MNPTQELVSNLQSLVAQVPEIIQPAIVMLAGAVPFVEGMGASSIGVVGGINPIVAGLSAAAGNFLAVLVVVLVGSRARAAVVNHRAARRQAVAVGARGGAPIELESEHDTGHGAESHEPESKGRQRFRRWMVRFGVPGASILGPLAIPTHVIAAILIGSGTPRGRVLLLQAVAITLWTTVTTILTWLAVNAVVLA